MKALIFAICLCSIVFASGCASVRPVRELSEEEIALTEKLKGRLKENRKQFNESLSELLNLSVLYMQDSNALHRNVAKAKLLESMKSPWEEPTPALAATRRSVALYHLYDLIETQDDLERAMIEERSLSISEVKASYGSFVSLVDKLMEGQRLLARHLNRSRSLEALSFMKNLSAETKAFRGNLETSDNPALLKLTDKVAKSESRVDQATQAIEEVIRATSER
jgi:hypothetical protein